MNIRQPRNLAARPDDRPDAVPFAAGSAAEPGRAARARALRADDLRCEYLVNPLGIDARAPRLSWTLQAVRSGGAGA